MSPRIKPLILFGLLLALFPAISSVVRWMQGETPDIWDWLGIAAFPALAWAWLRCFSVLGCKDGCRLTAASDHSASPPP